jgi:rhamnosyltransferase subunit B
MKRFLLHTFGSLGDLHPFIALGLGLKARGHQVSIGTVSHYQQRVEAAGLGFHAIRPNFDPNDPALLAKIMDAANGTRYVFKELTLPHLQDTYQDLSAAVKNVDVLVSAPLTLAAPIVAEKTPVTWLSSVLAPVSFFSAYDPSVVSSPLSEWMSRRGPTLNRWFFNTGKRITNSWARPLYDFRQSLGLARGKHPFFEGQHSEVCALALFSRHLAAPQKDWPKNSQATGFLFYDGSYGRTMDADLETFLQSGEPPVVFTLGSSAVHTAGDFYSQSLEAAKQLNCRAILLVGKEGKKLLPASLPKNIFVAAYAPYSQLFPRASLVVHQGGIGTTAQVFHAGKPALIVPFAHDQFDHAVRVKRLGIGLSLDRRNYKVKQVMGRLEQLLGHQTIQNNALQLGEKIRAERGLENACDAIARAVKIKDYHA